MAKSPKIINVSITFRNTEATEPLRKYAEEKLSHCVQKFVHQDTEVHVVLTVEKHRQIAEATMHVDGSSIHALGEGDKLYAAIDALVDSVTQQLRKNKEKLTSHHAR